jgi:hypothetical protein
MVPPFGFQCSGAQDIVDNVLRYAEVQRDIERIETRPPNLQHLPE